MDPILENYLYKDRNLLHAHLGPTGLGCRRGFMQDEADQDSEFRVYGLGV